MSLSGDKGVAQFKKSVKMGHPSDEETSCQEQRVKEQVKRQENLRYLQRQTFKEVIGNIRRVN